MLKINICILVIVFSMLVNHITMATDLFVKKEYEEKRSFIMDRYPNLFYTEKQLSDIFEKEWIQNQYHYPVFKRERRSLHLDEEFCCPITPTFQMLDVLQNLDGLERPIIHFEDAYQVIPWVSCSSEGLCPECRSRNRTISLLAWENATELIPTFDLFSVPLYCTCIPG
ncbi:Hypothetical predicted protein [Octopus vulgaris]|uniref:Uncharacterized protein n=1 Tax=Octopus vulgaris TaxID=6645 RepID=A0AA36F3Z1_OCTVU|nr:Hypothetical predicted protein [Octopus vulgaris]